MAVNHVMAQLMGKCKVNPSRMSDFCIVENTPFLFVGGTVLSRLYQEQEYRVTVTHDGQFDFEGRTYKSLSVIAREITGTRWSGPLFF
jgi:hypothetical protein